MDDILVGLNPAQQEAVTKIFGVMLVLAGAGSGKTRVLTNRIAYLIKNGADPNEILAVTFTNKAAQEMKSRLTKMLGEDIVKNLWVGTFHNICCRILRQDIEKYENEEGRKWQSNFVIFDQSDSVSLVKQAIQAENLDEKMYVPKAIQSTISMAKNKMIDAYKYATNARDFRSERISKIYDNYEKLLATNNALDFDDLLLMSVNLIAKNADVRRKYHSRFKHVLVDEFQDTNLVQYRLISMIYHGGIENPQFTDRSLCVVGDVDQSIYSWRGADCKIILNFERDYSTCELIKLEQNYRSTGTILEAANRVIVNNSERLDKKLISNKGKGEKISCFEAHDEQEESQHIANKIKNLIANKFSLNDCVVLYRTNAQSRAIEEAFMSQNIPYKMIGGVKFYERKEVKDIIAYLKLIYNPDDSQSLKRVINVPKRSIGATTVNKIQDIANRNDTSMFTALSRIEEFQEFTARTSKPLKEFYTLIASLRDKALSMPLSEFIAQLIDDTGYYGELKGENTEESNNRLENLQEFISVAREYETDTDEPDLGEFLSQVALVSDVDMLEEESQSVTLMTLHAAKGLEFPIVFLAGLEDGIFPHMRSLQSSSEMEEERRLMYVGITRAEEMLFLSYAKKRLIWGDYKYFTPSRFLSEIPPQLLDSVSSEDYIRKPSVLSTAKKEGAWAHQKDTYNSSDKVVNDYSVGFGKNFRIPKANKPIEPSAPAKPVQTVSRVSVIEKPKAQEPAKFTVKPPEKPAVLLNKEPAVKPIIKTVPVEKKEAAPAPVETAPADNREYFQKGDRVFHEKFGIGMVEQVIELGSDLMYQIDFGKAGKKPIDANYAKLKKF